ncbi:MAG: hypothetical protein ACREA0_34535 [bacterium]
MKFILAVTTSPAPVLFAVAFLLTASVFNGAGSMADANGAASGAFRLEPGIVLRPGKLLCGDGVTGLDFPLGSVLVGVSLQGYFTADA